MDDVIKQKLIDAGIDVNEGVSRFLDDYDMFCELELKFFETNQLIELKKEIDAGNVTGAFDAAHSLKGVCGNLSMKCLSAIIIPMVETLRKGSFDGVSEAYDRLVVQYDKLEKVVKGVCG